MNFEVGQMTMKSAIGEASKHVYRKVDSRVGTWLVRQGKYAADNIYWLKDGRGMGGATIKFKLEDGSVFEAKGPWLTNAGELFQYTGIDLREKLSTFVVLSDNVVYDKNYDPILVNVLYKDSEIKESVYDRGSSLAHEWAERLGKKIYYYQLTAGGSLFGSAVPEKVNQ